MSDQIIRVCIRMDDHSYLWDDRRMYLSLMYNACIDSDVVQDNDSLVHVNFTFRYDQLYKELLGSITYLLSIKDEEQPSVWAASMNQLVMAVVKHVFDNPKWYTKLEQHPGFIRLRAYRDACDVYLVELVEE